MGNKLCCSAIPDNSRGAPQRFLDPNYNSSKGLNNSSSRISR